MKLTLHTWLTLDGVMQAPGSPGEDADGNFTHGGWSVPYGNDDRETMPGWFAHASAFLFGRKTYELFAAYWPKITDPGHPIASKLNTLPKFVASTTLQAVDWEPSTLLRGDVVAEVAKLKAQPGGELQVHGSGVLAHTLIDNALVDEYRLIFFPVHLGTGKRLFAEGVTPGALRLLDIKTSTDGLVIARYTPDGAVRYGIMGGSPTNLHRQDADVRGAQAG